MVVCVGVNSSSITQFVCIFFCILHEGGGRLIFGDWDKIFEFWTNIRLFDKIPGFGTNLWALGQNLRVLDKYSFIRQNPWVLDKSLGPWTNPCFGFGQNLMKQFKIKGG